METNRFSHILAKSPGQPFAATQFVTVIDAAHRRGIFKAVQKVADIMQQCSADQRGVGAGFLSDRCALQRVLKLRDPLATILSTAALLEKLKRPRLRDPADRVLLLFDLARMDADPGRQPERCSAWPASVSTRATPARIRTSICSPRREKSAA